MTLTSSSSADIGRPVSALIAIYFTVIINRMIHFRSPNCCISRNEDIYFVD